MQIEDRVRKKIETLISSADGLRKGDEDDEVRSENHKQECIGWLVSAQYAVHLLIANPDNPYRSTVDKICSVDCGCYTHQSVGEVMVILQSLLQDIDAGLLVSIEDQARVSVFDDFLDHAKEYLKQRKHKEAGVIAGVVFEDTIRSISRNTGVEEKGKKLDTLITDLVRTEKLSQVMAKRARVAAHVRTKATHAQWNEFELEDVKTTVEFTEKLISKCLDR